MSAVSKASTVPGLSPSTGLGHMIYILTFDELCMPGHLSCDFGKATEPPHEQGERRAGCHQVADQSAPCVSEQQPKQMWMI